MNPHTNEVSKQHAEEKCKLANERFGYREALRLTLVELGWFAEAEVEGLLELAKYREFDKFVGPVKTAMEFWKIR